MNRTGNGFMQRLRRVRWMSTNGSATTQSKQNQTHTHTPKYEAPQEKKGLFGRVGNFFKTNRQGFINILAVYFTLSLAISNYKHTVESKVMNDDLAALREKLEGKETAISALETDSFIDSAIHKIQSASSLQGKKESLRTAIKEALVVKTSKENIKKEDELGAVLQQVFVEESVPNVKKPRMM